MALTPIQQMILDGEPVLKQITHPEAQLLRKSEVEAVKAGKPDNQCPHPIGAITQFMDDPGSGRPEVPVNLYQCEVCNETLWLVSAHGRAAADG